MVLNNEWVKNEIKEEIQKFMEKKWKWTCNIPKLMEHTKSSPEKEVHNDRGLPEKDRIISNKKPNPTSTITWGTTKKV